MKAGPFVCHLSLRQTHRAVEVMSAFRKRVCRLEAGQGVGVSRMQSNGSTQGDAGFGVAQTSKFIGEWMPLSRLPVIEIDDT